VQNRLGEVQSAIVSPVELMRRFLGTTPAPPPVPAATEVDALRRRVAELEARLEKGKRGKVRKGKGR
jgi:hypothetical protein